MGAQRFWKWTKKHMSFPTKTCPLYHLSPFQGALITRSGWSLGHFLFAWATGFNRGGSVRGGSVLMFAKIHCISDQPPWLPVLRAQFLALYVVLWVYSCSTSSNILRQSRQENKELYSLVGSIQTAVVSERNSRELKALRGQGPPSTSCLVGHVSIVGGGGAHTLKCQQQQRHWGIVISTKEKGYTMVTSREDDHNKDINGYIPIMVPLSYQYGYREFS